MLIENVTLLRSPFWVIHPLLCKNVIVRGVHINNDGPNGDGCDPESCNGVLIENCFFNTGDDCIAVKSGRNNDGRLWNKPSENIIIRNCEMQNGHGGVVIGSEITGGCRNLYAENCKMDSPDLDRVIRIKTNTCRGGIIENIYARNIEVGQCGESVLKINLDYEPKEICCRGFAPTVRNVNIENITCNKSKYGVLIVALDSITNVYDINVKNCHFNGVEKGNKIAFLSENEIAITTLFEILMGNLEPDEGSFKWGVSTSQSYFPLDNTSYFEGCDKSILEWLGEYNQSNDRTETYLRGFLGRMLFSGEDVFKPVKVLSGGEKVRCMLARMMMFGSNVLVLDQPTNHLDLESITAVNNGLKNFKGIVLFSSHDHEFISTVANRIIFIKPQGIQDITQSYDEYLEQNMLTRQ